MLHFNILLVFSSFCYGYGLEKNEGWNSINLHCRNNQNEPVDWWYLLKPGGIAAPYDVSGRNFSYITSEEPQRWTQPIRHISTNNMLQGTLAPIYRKSYTDHIAYIAYDYAVVGGKDGPKARGVLLADEVGGLFMSHTVPNLVNLKLDRPMFPFDELMNGHLIVCISMDIEGLNELFSSIKQVGIYITAKHISKAMEDVVPAWMDKGHGHHQKSHPVLKLNSNQTSLDGVIMFRRPGQHVCLYTEFAKSQSLVLDIYSPDHRPKKSRCIIDYGIRSIDSISLKIPEMPVRYINNSTDETRFGVSTVAHWQRRGSAPVAVQWTCTSSLDLNDRSTRGGILLCVNNPHIWHTFDNLKIKEPSCK